MVSIINKIITRESMLNSYFLNVIFTQSPVESSTCKSQLFSSFGDVTAMLFYYPQNSIFFQMAKVGVFIAGRNRNRHRFNWGEDQISALQHLAIAHDNGTFYCVLQLAHIAGIMVRLQLFNS